MKLSVAKRSDVTSNNNYILTLVGDDEIIKTALGNKTKRHKYLCAVVADKDAPAVGTELDIDLSQFTVSARESQFVSEDTGELITVTNKWLSL